MTASQKDVDMCCMETVKVRQRYYEYK